MAALEDFCRDLPYIGNASRNCGSGSGLRAHKMGAYFRTLPVLEVAVGRRDTALARRAAVAIPTCAHGAAGFAPEKPGIAKDAIKSRGLGRAFHRCRSR